MEAAKLFTPRAAKLATQEAAKLVAVLVEPDARLFGRALRGLLIRRELGADGANARGAAKLIAPGAAKLATC